MKKRILCLLLLALALLVCASAAADTPNPIEIIPYEQIPENLDGQHHYLLLCVDQWTGKPDNLGDTDGIVIVTVDSRAHRVMLTSIIRDSLVVRPDGNIGRINYIAKRYGPDELCKVISQHLGIKLEKYILFDFRQIQSIINYLGGVDITVNQAQIRYLTRYAINPNATTPRLSKPGTYHFNGHAAVIYMRIRKAGGGDDFMRTQRARTVLSTLADQCRTITYEDATALVENIMENNTMTNMNLNEMMEAMGYAFDLRDCTIEQLRIPVDGTVEPINYASMAAQQLDWPANRAAFANFLVSSVLVEHE